MSQTEDLSPLFDISGRKLFERRMIILSESIHAHSAKLVNEKLLAMEATDTTKPIWLFLNSPGGEVSSGFSIYDTMRFIRPEIKVIVSGIAASIATIILLGAKKEYRYALPNSRLLIHQPLISGSIQGQASDIEIHAKEILKTREKIAKIYHQETKQTMEKITKDMERDFWMTPEDAVEYGLVTKIIQNWNDVA
ncbi:MAG: ATP-dependent Clp protease proteolytic subunit [Silvanigrellaceae bacterium]|nr:ATP-dependent Clp protease proteolytic subunit [Silvanigrellaceae bacterium]